ncbi:poly(A)-specific ribonuclease [Cyberlindnera jadinii NRRL Y-1542]|uniref:Cysteine proteinase n=1 Tax=Cyberlindnera jadinii (strain ATCC 18201 / CBS 1600 / BCRC 20928 / JCM 3617 / NBRC 0987 / NRRL Y-1542) TaxID=983966 RepID=A0A1E4RV70_CYBJN|nr:cysteine proteinase [Cyberlindnera jadinii NRRL Y-1542]ODV71111.1 cysteine proteinase [Cyberlindnera jadinii NRRL Y-1542]
MASSGSLNGWREISRVPATSPARDKTSKAKATCSAFDEQCDLVWVGDSFGYIRSFEGPQLSNYTKFKAHLSPVKHLISHHKGIISTDGISLRLTSRRGLVVFDIDSSTNPELTSISSISLVGTNELLVSTDRALLRFDVVKTQVIKTIPYNKEVSLMASNKRYAALASSNDNVDIYEVKSETVVAHFQVNFSKITGLDLKEQTLVVCGTTDRHGVARFNTWVSVYDLRTQAPLNPITSPDGAEFVRLHPRLPSVALIASPQGLVQSVNMFDPDSSTYFPVQADSLKSFELSSTGDFLCMVDNASILHLFCLDPDHSAMSKRVAIEHPDVVKPHPFVSVNDSEFSLNQIGMPYYRETLLSAWPSHISFRSPGTFSRPIDMSLLRNAINENGLISAPYSKEKYGSRNEMKPYVSMSQSNEPARKFLSNKKNNVKASGKTSKVFQYISSSPNTIPNAFKKMEISYSKFGIDDFDFDFYNKTQFSGLESHVDNSYTNSLLQLYRFVPEFFNFIIKNLAVENLNEDSLLTELGYLYDMLAKAHGKHYRPTNFQHTLSNNEYARKFDLIKTDDISPQDTDLARRLKDFNKFLLHKLADDEKQVNVGSARLDVFPQLLGIRTEVIERWIYSNNTNIDHRCIFTLDVRSPLANNATSVLSDNGNVSIIHYIQSSMNRVSRAADDLPGGYQDIKDTSTTVVALPPVLSCNLDLLEVDKVQIRNNKDWFKDRFNAFKNGSGYVLTEQQPGSEDLDFCKQYEVVGFVCEIAGERDNDSHLVTFVKIPNEETGTTDWHLFNDFLVMPIPEEEVFNMSYWWKTPLTIVYKRVTSVAVPFQYDCWKNDLNDQILYRDHFASAIRESRRLEYKLLTREEAPHPGSLIAIDAEFVILENEQYEIGNSGIRSLLKPKKSALARVSVLRGDDGENYGVPFIDDYVAVNEPITDYLTSFSGIEPGDLDPSTSTRMLVTRQTVYRKLWLLLNLGCVFVGHGLIMDFRTINICVPKEQVRDTAVFFHKGQRILSLRFLAYILLNVKVQLGNHDSIEDAYTALLIYKKYLELQRSGQFEETLDRIFHEGQALKFKPPGED